MQRNESFFMYCRLSMTNGSCITTMLRSVNFVESYLERENFGAQSLKSHLEKSRASFHPSLSRIRLCACAFRLWKPCGCRRPSRPCSTATRPKPCAESESKPQPRSCPHANAFTCSGSQCLEASLGRCDHRQAAARQQDQAQRLHRRLSVCRPSEGGLLPGYCRPLHG